MVISFIKKFFRQLSKSGWLQIYFTLVIVQIILSIPILLKTLINTENVEQSAVQSEQNDLENSDRLIFGTDLAAKGYKVIYENCLFIAFEAWRLWVLIDGIVHQNSLTILASAWFSILTGCLDIMLIVESNKWMQVYYDPRKMENMYLQIVLTVVLFLLSVPVIISAFKSVKVIGWQVYKRIGSSIELQQMFYQVQWLEFWLKVDIFFELLLTVFTSVITTSLPFRIICIIMAIFIAFGLVLSRIAISYESQWMMFTFLFLQLLLFLCDMYSLFGLFSYSVKDRWLTGIIFEFVSIACILVTVYFCIVCQINFGKGLKAFVYWFPFRDTRNKTNNSGNADILSRRSTEYASPIDDEEDIVEEGKIAQNQKLLTHSFRQEPIPRTSLERVDRHDIRASPRDKIKIKTQAPYNRVIMQPIQTSPVPYSPPSLYTPPISLHEKSDTYSLNSIRLESTISDSIRPIVLGSTTSPRNISPRLIKTTITTTVVSEHSYT